MIGRRVGDAESELRIGVSKPTGIKGVTGKKRNGGRLNGKKKERKKERKNKNE